MKRIVLVIIAVSSLLYSCAPLKIVMDNTKKNGERNLLTSNQRLFSQDNATFDIAMGCRATSRDTILGLVITADTDVKHGIFTKDDKLMFRLSDGEEIALPNLYEKEYEEVNETHVSEVPKTEFGYAYSYSPFYDDIYVTPYEINRMVPKVYSSHSNNSYALYLISLKQLDSIISKGVVKLRVESEDRDYDMTDPSSVAQLFSSLKSCMREAVSLKKGRSDF